ncbi:MAG TPA: hypothetical protein VIU46_04565 [Gallionellaceae bacterium]
MSMPYLAIPFAAALLLPTRQMLAEFAAIFLPLLIWAGASSGYASPAPILLAFTCGLGMRKLVAALHARLLCKKRVVFFALAGTAAFAIFPGSVAAGLSVIGHSASAEYHNWETRAPAEECLARKYAVTVAGTAYYLPASPTLTIGAGKTTYHLQSGKSQRAICERNQGKKGPIHAKNILIDTSIPMRGPFCRVTRSDWNLDFCSDAKTARSTYPTLVNLYSPGEYDRQHLADGDTYADFVASRDKAIAAGHPFALEQSGIFDHYANGYWVAHNGAWKNDAGDPFSIKCQESGAGMLSCATSYRLKGGPQVKYYFNAHANKLETIAVDMDLNFHLMLAELATP